MLGPPGAPAGIRGAVHVTKLAKRAGRGGVNPLATIEAATPVPADAAIPMAVRRPPTAAAPVAITGTVGPSLRAETTRMAGPPVLGRRAAAIQAEAEDAAKTAGRATAIKAPLARKMGAPPPLVRAAVRDHGFEGLAVGPARATPAVTGAVPVVLGEDPPGPSKTLMAHANAVVTGGGRPLPEGLIPGLVTRVTTRAVASRLARPSLAATS